MAPWGFCYIWAGLFIRREVVLETEGVCLSKPTQIRVPFFGRVIRQRLRFCLCRSRLKPIAQQKHLTSADTGAAKLPASDAELQQLIYPAQNASRTNFCGSSWPPARKSHFSGTQALFRMLAALEVSSWDPVALPSVAHDSDPSLQGNSAVSTITKLLVLSLMFSAGCAGGTEIGQERSNCSMRLWMRSCISKEILQEKLWGDTRLFWEQRFPKMSSIFSSEWNRVDFWWYLWDHFRKNLPLAILAKNFFHPLNETTKSSSQYI